MTLASTGENMEQEEVLYIAARNINLDTLFREQFGKISH